MVTALIITLVVVCIAYLNLWLFRHPTTPPVVQQQQPHPHPVWPEPKLTPEVQAVFDSLNHRTVRMAKADERIFLAALTTRTVDPNHKVRRELKRRRSN